jgi:predicted DNA-binding transcriptional regulator AlpA
MAYPAYLREKARKLRVEKRLTIDELAECLALSRSTIYYWVRDLPIERKPNSEWPESARLAGGRAIRVRYQRLRDRAFEEGRRSFANLAADPSFRDFVNLYIAEGYKRNRNVVSICNSDPVVIRLAHHWMRQLATNKLTYGLQYHADQDPEYLKRFWASGLPGVEPDAISLQRKSNSNGLAARKWRSRWGVLAVTANDTQFRMRLEGWIVELQQAWLDSLNPGV